jgi:hypothetical protein
LAVAIVFPVAYIMSFLTKTTWFFKRGGSKDSREKRLTDLYKWLDKKWASSPRSHLLVYPEGHRMGNSTKPGKLKDGMINVILLKIGAKRE